MPPNRKLFISYSHADMAVVQNLNEVLTALYFEVWYDKQLLNQGGHRFWDGVLDAIQTCDVFIFAYSEDSNKSPYCQLEYAWASALCRHILPIRVRDFGILLHNPKLTDLHKMEYLDYFEYSATNLVSIYRSIVDTRVSSLPNPLPLRPDAPEAVLAILTQKSEDEEVSDDVVRSFEDLTEDVISRRGVHVKKNDLCWLLDKYLGKSELRPLARDHNEVRRKLQECKNKLSCS